MTWKVHDAGSWGLATTDTPADMGAALELPASWKVDPRRALIRRDQWPNLEAPVPPGPPTLTGMTPNVGPVSGGTTSTLQGTGLTGVTAIYYGGNLAVSFTVTNDRTIEVTSPPAPGLTPGNVNVNVMRGVASNPVQFDYQ